MCQLFWVFYLTAISRNTFYFLYFAICLNIVTAVACYWVPESPRYLYGINNLDKCKEVFSYIASMNGIKDYEPPSFPADIEIDIDDNQFGGSRESGQGPKETRNSNFDSLLSEREREATTNSKKEIKIEDADESAPLASGEISPTKRT